PPSGGWNHIAMPLPLLTRLLKSPATACQYGISIREGLIHWRLQKNVRPGRAYRHRQILSVLMHRKAGSAFGARRMNTAVSVMRFWYARQTETTRILRDTLPLVRQFRFPAALSKHAGVAMTNCITSAMMPRGRLPIMSCMCMLIRNLINSVLRER